MPNSFTVFPNVLPGNVTIGGNLTVSGDQLRIGAAAPFVRVGKDTGGNIMVSQNLLPDDNTVDSPGTAAYALLARINGNDERERRINAAGSLADKAFTTAIFTDYNAHSHTGTTTEDTIYSKTIPANTLGANGALRIHVRIRPTAQGAAATSLRVRLGGVALTSGTFTWTSTSTFWLDLYLANAGAANSQNSDGVLTNIVAGTLLGSTGTSAVDTTVDQTLTVTVQNGTSTDTQVFEHISVHQLNSFGPV